MSRNIDSPRILGRGQRSLRTFDSSYPTRSTVMAIVGTYNHEHAGRRVAGTVRGAYDANGKIVPGTQDTDVTVVTQRTRRGRISLF